jgi:hypothetical protein
MCLLDLHLLFWILLIYDFEITGEYRPSVELSFFETGQVLSSLFTQLLFKTTMFLEGMHHQWSSIRSRFVTHSNDVAVMRKQYNMLR